MKKYISVIVAILIMSLSLGLCGCSEGAANVPEDNVKNAIKTVKGNVTEVKDTVADKLDDAKSAVTDGIKQVEDALSRKEELEAEQQEAKEKAEAEAKQKAEQEAKEKAEAEAKQKAEQEAKEKADVKPQEEKVVYYRSGTPEAGVTYVVNTNTKRIHKASCKSVLQMAEKNRVDLKLTLDEARSMYSGYKPCGNCHPF